VRETNKKTKRLRTFNVGFRCFIASTVKIFEFESDLSFGGFLLEGLLYDFSSLAIQLRTEIFDFGNIQKQRVADRASLMTSLIEISYC
jgi:hypothetical protein